MLGVGYTSDVHLMCEDAMAITRVLVGYGIARLDVSPAAIEAPGIVQVQWESNEAESCDLSLDGQLVASGLTGPADVQVNASGTFELTCNHSTFGPVSEQRPVYVGTTAVLGDVNPTGGPDVFVRWSSALADSCDLSFDAGAGPVTTPGLQPSGEQVFNDVLPPGTASLTVTLTCSGASGSDTDQRVFTVTSIESFTASPSELPQGGGTTNVCWSTTNALQCYLDGTPVVASGRQDVTVGGTQQLYLSCEGDPAAGPFAFDDQNLLIVAGPTIRELTLDDISFAQSGEVFIRWDTVGTTSCQLLENGVDVISGLPSTVAGDILRPLPDVTTYELVCVDGGGAEVRDSRTATPGGGGGGVTFNYVNLIETSPTTAELQWSALNAFECNILFSGDFTGPGQFSSQPPDATLTIDLDPSWVSVTATVDCVGPNGPGSEQRTLAR